jgi:regulator of cell morphogenesis and NO signaling
MYLVSKKYIVPETEVAEIIKNNPMLLLALENFGVTKFEKGITVSALCSKTGINVNFFTLVCNLHNGFYIENAGNISAADLPIIIAYLKRSHEYYRSEKYPEILGFIRELRQSDNSNILQVIETYFNEYFEEVKEHIEYEERTAFPYFNALIENKIVSEKDNYSSTDYKEHHTDIETRLNDLKDLFIHHVHTTDKNRIRRKLLTSLSELEFELKVHSHIEDMILIPLTNKIEKKIIND